MTYENPYGQLSRRKDSPRSFLNRFATTNISILEKLDLKIICQQLYEEISDDIIDKMLNFKEKFHSNQWDFYLRDLLKWCQMFNENKLQALGLIYIKRMRTKKDQNRIRQLYQTSSMGSQPQKTTSVSKNIFA